MSTPPPRVFTLEEIHATLRTFGLPAQLGIIADAHVALSRKRIVLGDVAHLDFKKDGTNADCCIKSGFALGGELWVVKVAAGFYDNPKVGMPSSCGLILLCDLKLGVPRALLADAGELTDLRTAIAAAVGARALAPRTPGAVGVIGAGCIASRLPDVLRVATACRTMLVYSRRQVAAAEFAERARALGWACSVAASPAELASRCGLVVTCTPSEQPLLRLVDLKRSQACGLHICAIGADAAGKQELETELVAAADLVVLDSKQQCLGFGEASHAQRAGLLRADRCLELGDLLSDSVHLQRGGAEDTRLTVFDSTGVAASDLAIAEAVYLRLMGQMSTERSPLHTWRENSTSGGAKSRL